MTVDVLPVRVRCHHKGKPEDYEAFLQKLEQQGYEVKRGKYTSVKGARQKRFIRFRCTANAEKKKSRNFLVPSSAVELKIT